MRYLTALVISLAACFGLQTAALKAVGGKTRKSESNYFSSIARIQTETAKRPRILLLGSSLMGRLPERPEVGNLGCDGGSAAVTLRAIDEGVLPRAALTIIEANTLSYELEKRGKDIAAAIRTDWFRIGREVPNLGATARPTAFPYSWMESRKASAANGSIDPAAASPFHGSPAALASSRMAAPQGAEKALSDDLSRMIAGLQPGGRVILVRLPAGNIETSVDLRLARTIAAANPDVLYWDMTEGLPPGAVGYTDGHHLDAPSAARVMDAIMDKCGK